MSDFTFLTEEQISGDNQLEIIKKYGAKCAITDFSILLGGIVSSKYYTSEGNSKKDRNGCWLNKTTYADIVHNVYDDGFRSYFNIIERLGGARPTLSYSSISSISSNKVIGKNGILEVEYGEYPQTVVLEEFAKTLERAYLNRNINQTGKSYTTDSVNYQDVNISFKARTHTEYEYNGKKYIRFVGDSNGRCNVLSDGRMIQDGSVYWVEVKPIKWLIDEKADIALSKRILFAGVQFDSGRYCNVDFEKTNIKEFMDDYFSKEIVPSKTSIYEKNRRKGIKVSNIDIKKLQEIVKEHDNELDNFEFKVKEKKLN